MARYSSDSDSDKSAGKYRKKHYRKSRSSSSDSSDSSPHRKRTLKSSKSKRRHRSRSKSRDTSRSSKNYRSSKASSKDRDRRRYKNKNSKSISPDRYRKKVRSVSREKSTSRSSSSQSYAKSTNDVKTFNFHVKDDFAIEPRIKESILEEINADGFAPRQFTPSTQIKDKKSNNKNILIDITSNTIQVPSAPKKSGLDESIFHYSISMDQDLRFDKWVKKLYNLRQKALAESLSSVT
ncbi:hypothetical protein HCN44_002585 [Aphidius gifuensis]|uniref:Uncharacterized protein n=1 Tax=Aphidius gifuensis TaxID=684658 RepID=A0A834Y4C5_APHGI|nr:pre-mRNA-splicing factor 38B-like [Aphidius gifuensis]KAF7996939.1 hypothetical protein HCN44_002585 [Aphidius gifuensis]